MYTNGTFLFETAYSMTLVQPGFSFAAYPNDQQTINIRYAILNYDAMQLQMYPVGIYCSLLSDDTCSFAHNAVWTWKENQDQCTVYYDPKSSTLVYPAYTQYLISVERQGNGTVVRLVLPITLLLLLSALTFWVAYENRVDSTITILLAVSALYIVILQNIPMVGYLTNVDKFVFVVRETPLC